MDNSQFVSWPGWEVVRLIGRGSFGAVYEIERDVFGEKEKAALKVISIPQNDNDIEELLADGYDDESITSTFQSHLKSIVAEYSLMRKMNGSANVVNCDDVRYVKHEDGIGWDIFIKMELLTPLTKALPEKVDESTVLKIALDMTAALTLCKSFNIVHRDIKPQNIFVSPLGDYKLGDFGIAKTVEKTMGGTKIGTYKYMAPEVYNNRPYGSTADIYSLGLVLYWLLNERRLPFLPLPPAKLGANMEDEARNRRLHGDAIPAPAHGSDALKRIVLKACAYDSKDRYQCAEEMHADLEALIGKPVYTAAIENDEVGMGNAEEVSPKSIIPNKDEKQPANAWETDFVVEQKSQAEDEANDVWNTIQQAVATNEDDNVVSRNTNFKSEQKTQAEEKNVGVCDSLKTDMVKSISNEPTHAPKKKKIEIIFGLVVILMLLTVGYFNIHSWVPATCTEAEHCKICGKIRGEALGHYWDGGYCLRCGEKL